MFDKFDKTHQYGNWVVIGADGPDDVLDPIDKESAERGLLKNAHNFIQDESLWPLITIIHHGPNWVQDPESAVGEGRYVFTVAWKYTPTKEAA